MWIRARLPRTFFLLNIHPFLDLEGVDSPGKFTYLPLPPSGFELTRWLVVVIYILDLEGQSHMCI